MSSYIAEYKNKEIGELVRVTCIDDYFGARAYGYIIDGNSEAMREEEFTKQYTYIPSEEV